MRILLIDDSELDRKMFIALMRGENGVSWLRDVAFHESERPLDNLEEYRAYSGIVMDVQLRGPKTGFEVAREINAFDWHIPIVILTGMLPGEIPVDVHDYVDYVTVKQILLGDRQHDDQFGIARAFARWLGRIKDARDGVR